MSRLVADDSIRDTNSHTYTIKNGQSPITFQYVNGLNAEITIDVEATYGEDDDFSDSITLESGKTVAASTTDYDTAGYPWEQMRFTVTATTSPSSGTLHIRKMV